MANDTEILRLVTVYDGTALSAGLSESANAVRSNTDQIKRSFEEAGREADYSMTEARHGVKLLSEEIGLHMPRAIATFVASLGPVGAAMAAAFPILAVVQLAEIIGEKIESIAEKPAKIAAAWEKYDEVVFTAGEHIRSEIDKEEQKLIEMTDGPVKALEYALQHLGTTAFETFKEISSSVEAAAAAMKEQASFFNVFGDAAKDLDQFRDKVGAAMRAAKAEHPEDSLAAYNAAIALVQAKERELTALIAQRTAASGKDASAAVDGLHAEREAINAMLPLLQQGIRLDQEKKDVAEEEVGRAQEQEADRAARQAAEFQKIAANDAEKAWQESYKRAVADLQESERQKILATANGTAARIAMIDAAINEENARGLQETEFYKSLLNQRIEATQKYSERQIKEAEEVAKLQEKIQLESLATQQKIVEEGFKENEAAIERAAQAKIAAGGGGKGGLGALTEVSADTQAYSQRLSAQEAFQAQSIALAQQESQAKILALNQVRAVMVADSVTNIANASSDAEKIKQIDEQLVAAAASEQNQETAIRAKGEAERFAIVQQYQRQIQAAQQQMAQAFANQIDNMLFHSRSFSDAMQKLWIDMVRSLIERMVLMTTTHLAQQATMASATAAGQAAQTAAVTAGSAARTNIGLIEDLKSIGRAAATAAAHAFKWVMEEVPFPANVVLAPAAAAGAFASVLAFGASAEGGWDVPGGSGTFPTILHPREMVLPSDIAQGVRNMTSASSLVTDSRQYDNSGVEWHFHQGDISALDSTGVADILKRERGAISKLVTGLIRSGHINPRAVLRG